MIAKVDSGNAIEAIVGRSAMFPFKMLIYFFNSHPFTATHFTIELETVSVFALWLSGWTKNSTGGVTWWKLSGADRSTTSFVPSIPSVLETNGIQLWGTEFVFGGCDRWLLLYQSIKNSFHVSSPWIENWWYHRDKPWITFSRATWNIPDDTGTAKTKVEAEQVSWSGGDSQRFAYQLLTGQPASDTYFQKGFHKILWLPVVSAHLEKTELGVSRSSLQKWGVP